VNAAGYVNQTLDIMERYSLRRNEINWPNFRGAVLADVNETATIEDTYPVLRAALKRLGDGHSFFATPAQVKWQEQQEELKPATPIGRSLDGPIGYIQMPAFGGSKPDQMTRFAQQTQDLIRTIERPDLAGWIVDLRDNTGGNMWPMIAGLGPLLGQGVLGAFVAPGGAQETWFYRDGGAGCDGGPICPPPSFLPPGPCYCRVEAPYRLLVPDPPVAVLIGPKTASSGEAVALAFRGRPRSRSFGAPTYGLTTGNNIFELSDGAFLFLASVVEADRTGQQFSSHIPPEEEVADNKASVLIDDAVVRAASAWLLRSAA
jgi:carboxyl-terminal processing protease